MASVTRGLAWSGVALGAGISLASGCTFQHARDAAFWLTLVATATNPLCFLPPQHRVLLPPLAFLSWLTMATAIVQLGDPALAFEQAWRWMTANFTLWQMAVYGSATLHITLTLLLNVSPILVQNVPHLQRHKIQGEKAPPSVEQWTHCFIHIFVSQLCVQLPLVSGLYFFMCYFQTPYEFDSFPRTWDLLWRLACALMIDDAWVYFGHRALHDRRIYKYVHKVHHTYKAPFAPDAEYEHPVETAVLGVGVFTGCMLFTNHLAFMWAWLYCRLLVSYDSHSGYDLPLNLFHAIPWYSGAREHDWHHAFFDGNYAPTFLWWDRVFGTNAPFLKFERRRRMQEATRRGAALEALGDKDFSNHSTENSSARSNSVDGVCASLLPFEGCVIVGPDCVLARRLVSMLATRGLKRIIWLGAAKVPASELDALKDSCMKGYSSELIVLEGESVLNKAVSIAGVEVVFHIGDDKDQQDVSDLLAELASIGKATMRNQVFIHCASLARQGACGVDLIQVGEQLQRSGKGTFDCLSSVSHSSSVVVSANGRIHAEQASIATCVVAAPWLYAPADDACVLALATGFSRIVGAGDSIASFTHVDNASHALILAATRLWNEGSTSAAAGEFFVVSDGGALSFWDAVDDVLVASGRPSLFSQQHIPSCFATVAASTCAVLKPRSAIDNLAAWVARLQASMQAFCTAKARHVLGYAPVVKFDDGWAEMVAAAQRIRASGLKEL